MANQSEHRCYFTVFLMQMSPKKNWAAITTIAPITASNAVPRLLYTVT